MSGSYTVYGKILSMSKGEDREPQITPGDDSQGDDFDSSIVSIDHNAPEVDDIEKVEDAEPHDIFETTETETETEAEPASEATSAPAEAAQETAETPVESPQASTPTTEQSSPFDSKTVTGTSNYSQRRSGGMRNFSSTDTNMQTPQFFNDAMVASAPISQPQRNRKPLIFLIVAIIVFAGIVAAVVFLLRSNNNEGGTSSGDQDKPASKELTSAFNEYFNYLYAKVESSEKINANSVDSDQRRYAINLIGENIEDNNKNSYITALNQKYEAFAKIYAAEYPDEDTSRLEDLHVYFYELGSINQIYDVELVNLYRANGSDKQKSLDTIRGRYTKSTNSQTLKNYLEYKTKAKEFEYDLFANSVRANCVVAEVIDYSCVKRTVNYDAIIKKASEYSTLAYKEYGKLETAAIKAVDYFCIKIYGVSSEEVKI